MNFETTGKQLFTVGYYDRIADICTVKVAVDFDNPEAAKRVKEMSMFWCNHPDEDDSLEEHLLFWLQLLASRCFYKTVQEHDTVHDLITSFEEEEGFYPLDGRHGILITAVDVLQPCSEEFEITDVTEYSSSFELKEASPL